MKRIFLKKFNAEVYLTIIKLAIPLIIANFLQNLYNLADTYYMGKLGGLELATSSFTSPITQMIIGAGSGFSLGGGVILNQTYGSKNFKKLVEVNTQLIIINLIIAIFILFFSFLFCENILKFSGASGELLEKSALYIKFIFLTIPMTFIVTAYITIKNSKGKTTAPLYLVTASVILNIILNSFFIYKLKWGLAGIGIATVIANLLLCIYCLLDLGLKAMIGKGARNQEVIDSIIKNKAIYLGAIGGAAALISKTIISSEVIAYEDLGAEAIRRMEVKDMPLTVIIDTKGNNLYNQGQEEYLRTIKS